MVTTKARYRPCSALWRGAPENRKIEVKLIHRAEDGQREHAPFAFLLPHGNLLMSRSWAGGKKGGQRQKNQAADIPGEHAAEGDGTDGERK